jgi:hypothetical protein
MKKMDKNENLESLRGEGITEGQAQMLLREIEQGEKWLERFAPAQADAALLARVQEAVTGRLAWRKRFARRLQTAAAIAAAIMIAWGVSLSLKTSRNLPTTPAPAPMSAQANGESASDEFTLSEAAQAETAVLLESGETSFMELFLLYEDIFDQNETWFDKENNHENQTNHSVQHFSGYVA